MSPSSDVPDGFSPGGDPLRAGQAGGPLPEDLAGKIPLFAELQKLLSWSGGPVNWELARQVAIAAAGGADPALSQQESNAAAEALRLADLWLDPVTALPSGMTAAEAWTRVGWVEQTLSTWSILCDPVAARVVDALRSGLPEEAQQAALPVMGVMGQMGGLLFGAQVGQALGSLAGEIVSATEIGLPLGPVGHAALLPANVAAFGAGLELPQQEVQLYLALREVAHHRLYGHVPWLRAHVVAAVEAYAQGITVDAEAIGRAMTELDASDPEAVQSALGGGMFRPETTAEQQRALARLETALALVEGWVADVVGAAAVGRLPAADALGETLRRRRASGGPAEATFANLVGLELRPRRLREAAAVWQSLRELRGIAGRDAVWEHPDLLPGADDLADPGHWLADDDQPTADPGPPSSA